MSTRRAAWLRAVALSKRVDSVTPRFGVHENATIIPLRSWLLDNPSSDTVAELLDKLVTREEKRMSPEKWKIEVKMEGDVKEAFEAFTTVDEDIATVLASYIINLKVNWSSPVLESDKNPLSIKVVKNIISGIYTNDPMTATVRGNWCAFYDLHSIKYRNLDSNSGYNSGSRSAPTAMCFSADGKRMFTTRARDSQVIIFSSTNPRKILDTWTSRELIGPHGIIHDAISDKICVICVSSMGVATLRTFTPEGRYVSQIPVPGMARAITAIGEHHWCLSANDYADMWIMEKISGTVVCEYKSQNNLHCHPMLLGDVVVVAGKTDKRIRILTTHNSFALGEVTAKGDVWEPSFLAPTSTPNQFLFKDSNAHTMQIIEFTQPLAVAFLCGFHRRVGKRSLLTKIAKHILFDKQLLRIPLRLGGALLNLHQNNKLPFQHPLLSPVVQPK